MAKRASILNENYNPVGARLARLVTPELPPLEEAPKGSDAPLEEDHLHSEPAEVGQLPEAESLPHRLLEREVIPDIPSDREIKDIAVRFRCTPSERRKWHEISREVTGEPNQLSHLIRASLLLLENAYEQLQKVGPDIQRLKRPASQDSLGLTMYEQRIAQYLYDAIKSGGRPKR